MEPEDRQGCAPPADSLPPDADDAPTNDEGLPVGLFVQTALLGLLVAVDVFVTRGEPLWGLPWRPAAIAAVIGGVRVTFSSLSGALEGEIGADLALAIATWAALWIGEPLAAAEVVFIAMTGESLEAIAFARTARALQRLLDLWPQTAHLITPDGEVDVPSHEVPVGALLAIRPGERLPVDGVIRTGQSSLDESSLTGESVPVDRTVGDPVHSGTQNLFGALRVEATRVGDATTLGQVVARVRAAQEQKAPLQRTADLYAAYFLPAVLLCALGTYVVSRDWYRTVAVLVVACPCALILATPAAVLAGIGRLARHGVLVKGGDVLEAMARVRTLAFDKTGTLTQARLEVATVIAWAGDQAEVLRLAAATEAGSEHPLALAIGRAAAARGLTFAAPAVSTARPGAGMIAEGPEGLLAVGNAHLLAELQIDLPQESAAAAERLAADGLTAVFVSRDGRLQGLLGLRDRLRADAPEAVALLHQRGLQRIALLTGDRPAVAAAVAREVGIDEVLAAQLPTDKAAWVRTRRNAGERVAMVGDGINDAPALAEADCGIAVADTGSDIAAEAADVVLLGDPLRQIPTLLDVSRQVLFTIRLSILGFAFGLNGVAVVLSAVGRLTPTQAAIFHQVGSLLVLLNAVRLLGFEPRADSRGGRLLHGLRELLHRVLALDIDGAVGWLAGHWKGLLRLKLRLLAVLWLGSCLVPIGADQVAVVRILGWPAGVYGPGLAFKPWWPLGRATLLRPAEMRSVELGFRTLPRKRGAPPAAAQYDWNSAHQAGTYRRMPEEALVLTGDENFVEVQAVLMYQIAAPQAYLYAAVQPETQLRALGEEALRAVIGQQPLDEVLTTARHTVELASAERLQAGCDRLGLGVRVAEVELADVHPPLEVVPSFRAVSSAFENKQQKINEAEAYANEQLALARGDAAAQREAALAYRTGRTARAEGDAARFRQRRQAAAAGRRVTLVRLWFEGVEQALAGRRKLVLDPAVVARRQFWSVDRALADAIRALATPPVDPNAVDAGGVAVPAPVAPNAPAPQTAAPPASTVPAPPPASSAPAAPAAAPGDGGNRSLLGLQLPSLPGLGGQGGGTP